MKKLISFVISLILLIIIIPISHIEGYAATSGKCGENVVWEYDDSAETLTISGEGDMIDRYAFFTFDENDSKIKTIVITEGVTIVGSYSFGVCINVTAVSIPVSVTKINKKAFENCDSLKNVYYAGTEAQWKKITIISDGNNYLLSAKINFTEEQHTCTFGEWSIVNQPTCDGDGSKIRKCSCGNSDVDTIPATGVHSFGDWNTTVVETEFQDGTETRMCSVCKYIETRVIDNIQSTDTDKNIVGDADGDGNVTAKDARLILQVVAGLKKNEDLNFVNADVKEDGEITAVDARMILQMVAGLI